MIRRFETIDAPDKRDYLLEDYLEFSWLEEKQTKRPYKEIILRDQKQEPACTRFALMHISNWQNINEYNAQWYKYEQKNPLDIWNAWSKNKYLQSALNEAKNNWYIEWYVRVKKNVDDIRKALSMWMYIYTGSYDWLWNNWKPPYNYVKRKDSKLSWHARPIVDDEPNNKRFVVANSFWTGRWAKWYFYLPYDNLSSTFSLYAIVDKDDSWKFKLFKQHQKAKEFIELAKDLYKEWTPEIKKWFDGIQLSKNITELYKIG